MDGIQHDAHHELPLIAKFRERRDLSQDEVSKILGVNRTAVAKWETGANKPRLDKIVELAKMTA